MQDAMIHPTAEVQTTHIGQGTCIWQNSVILPDAKIGKNCNINCQVFIENDVVIGDNVTVKSGVQLWDGMRVEDNVFIGPNATFTNDLRPRAGQRPDHFLQTTLRKGASIGANATIIGRRTIGCYAMIGAGSVVTHDIPDHTLWYGNPARFKGYLCRCGNKLDSNLMCSVCNEKLLLEGAAIQHTAQQTQMPRMGKISDKCVIHENVKIGENVTICDDAIVYSNVVIGDNSFIGPGCILGEPVMGFYQDSAAYNNEPLIIGKHSIIRAKTVIYSGTEIGDYFQSGHHATIREKTKIGHHCSLGSYGDIQGYVDIGDYCRFHSSVHIGQYSTIKDYVFIFPNSVLTNDPHPPSDTCIKGPTLEDYSVICAGAILMPAITVGKEAVVGANSLVNKDVEPEKVVLGIPARPICTIHDIKCREGNLEKPYPWKNHFSRGMPW